MIRSSVIVSVLSLFVTLTSFINQLVIARFFGTGAHMDSYLVAISIPFLVMGMIGGVISYSIIPILTQHRVDHPNAHIGYFVNLLVAFAILGALLSVLAYWMSPILVRILAPLLSGDLQAEAILIARISWVAAAWAIMASYLGAVHNSARRFMWPVLASFLPYIGMITLSVLWAHQMGIVTLAWGLLGGNILALLVLCAGAARDLHSGFTVQRVWRDASPILFTMPLVLVSTLSFAIYGTMDAFWASRLGPSNLSYLGYGQRIIIALGSVVIQGPSVVIAPYLAEIAALGQMPEFRRLTAQALRMVIALAAPAALIVTVLRVPIIELLFQRGAFDVQATQEVASVLPLMLLGMVAMTGVVLLLRALHARRDLVSAGMIGGAGALLYFILSGVFSQWLGLLGIVLAYAVTWWSLLGLSIWRLWRGEAMHVFAMNNLRFAMSLLMSLAACAVSVWLSWHFLPRASVEAGPIGLGVRLVVVAGCGGVAFLGVSAGLLRMPEIMVLIQRIPVTRALGSH